MSRHLKGLLAALVALVGVSALESRAVDAPRPTIAIAVYNYAGIPPKTLGDAKRVAGRIFWQAGVAIRWRNAPLGQIDERSQANWKDAFGPATLVLRLLPSEMTQRLGFQAEHYGFAQTALGEGFPFAAGVFCDRAERLAKGTRSRVPIILGNLVAHEVGHLLLGPYAHRNHGIMRPAWGKAELELARRGALRFSGSEAALIRSNALARIAADTEGKDSRAASSRF